ncbi:hypothetical protein AU193_14010 [Mycobacterium sp. GA-1285]|uniref:hypothetical protein n=1 Tax=Mycobacterium sp. GA-1285 TaxID=1772282 RepID=UPI000749EDAD|nr:hypothetical protein [Mycobacterium sp. GA-1285]KUI21668.1 hypothetical protein AU193_14010 [Mycobacterium sp. GA-1285]
MGSNSAFTGVAVAGMTRTIHVAATAAHPAFAAAHAAGAAAAITPQRKRRAAATTVSSVDRGTT